MKIKALSVRQPWAGMIASGEKTIETRVWKTSYRGDILICASAKGEGEPKGQAICIVKLRDIRPMTQFDEAEARINEYPNAKAWLLEKRVFVLDAPFQVKGKLNLFEVELPEDIARRYSEWSSSF